MNCTSSRPKFNDKQKSVDEIISSNAEKCNVTPNA